MSDALANCNRAIRVENTSSSGCFLGQDTEHDGKHMNKYRVLTRISSAQFQARVWKMPIFKRNRRGDVEIGSTKLKYDKAVDILHVGLLRTSLYEEYQPFVLRDNGTLSTGYGRVWLVMVGAEVIVNPDVYSFRICERARPSASALYTTVQAPSLAQYEAWRKAFETVLHGVHVSDLYKVEVWQPLTVGPHAMLFPGTRIDPVMTVVVKVVPRLFPTDHRSFAITQVSRAIRDGVLKSDHLAHVLDVYHTSNETHIVMPRYGPAMHRKLQAGEKWDSKRAKLLFRQLVDALRTMHHANYIHGAVVPSNVLIESENPLRVRLSGSCLASCPDPWSQDTKLAPAGRTLDEIQRALSHDAIQYMAPELHTEGSVEMSMSTDYWALGVLMYRVLTGEEPFLVSRIADDSPSLHFNSPLDVMLAYMELYNEVELLLPSGIKHDLNEDTISLIALLMSPSPDRRDGAAVKQHPWCRAEEKDDIEE